MVIYWDCDCRPGSLVVSQRFGFERSLNFPSCCSIDCHYVLAAGHLQGIESGCSYEIWRLNEAILIYEESAIALVMQGFWTAFAFDHATGFARLRLIGLAF